MRTVLGDTVMARSRGSRSAQRGTTASATYDDVLWRSIFAPTFTVPEVRMLREAEDLRTWSPDPDPAPVNIHGGRTRFVVAPSIRVHKRSVVARNYFTNTPVGFQFPYGIKISSAFPVVTCVRRKIRRSVMFALGKTGKGSRSPRRRNDRSNVRC